MSTRWFVAKYIPDMRRREPVNIGIVLDADGIVLSRFIGEAGEGRIDGRKATFTRASSNYKAWVDYWQHHIRRRTYECIFTKRTDDSYFIEQGGELLLGSDNTEPEELLQELYGIVVEQTSVPTSYSVTQLSERLFLSLEISGDIRKNERLSVSAENGREDELTFDYRFDNGSAHLMQKVSLAAIGERAWHAVHAAAWMFRSATNVKLAGPMGRELSPKFVALVKLPESEETKDQEKQMGILQSHALVVNVGHQQKAADILADALHLGSLSGP